MVKRITHKLSQHCLTVLVVFALCGGMLAANEASAQRDRSLVKAWIKSSRPQTKRVRTLDDLGNFKPLKDRRLDQFGGTLAFPSAEATGFFRTQKIDGRWWLIDPEGRRFLHVAVNSVKPYTGPTFKEAFPKRFRDEKDWATKTAALLRSHGFNGTGAWTDNKLLKTASQQQVYTRMLNFMSSFGRKLKLTKQGSGHQSYKDRLIPVFHPDFPAHCKKIAQQLANTKEDPYLLGVFSDNELEYNDSALDLHLQFPSDSAEREAALRWLATYHPDKSYSEHLAKEIRLAYVGYMFETYYKIVSRAIREVDSNHLYLGSRLHGAAKDNRWILAAGGRHLDVIALNVYRVWTPTKQVAKWERWSGKPMIVSEFYAKGQDSGLANLSGAGWTVPTQSDRGKFYQHFTLGLLESRACVGWHYFKYADNDPLDLTTDPSNRDSNKGILNSRYEPWSDFLSSVQETNKQVYSLVAYFDRE